MRLHFQPLRDQKVHVHCINCQEETVEQLGPTVYRCRSCRQTYQRAIIIDPKVVWYLGEDGEYCHETVGVLVVNERNELLFFGRTKYPLQVTIPAGHRDIGENAQSTAQRELREETGYDVPEALLEWVDMHDLPGDGCRRGSDRHVWSLFITRKPARQSLRITEDEGDSPIWMDIDQALALPKGELTYATREILMRNRARIETWLASM